MTELMMKAPTDAGPQPESKMSVAPSGGAHEGDARVLESPPPKPFLTIRPGSGWAALNFHEVWQFRDLMFTLASRDLKVRYKQTALGVIWIVLQPLMGAGVFSLVFGMVAKLPSEPGVPYFVFSYAGLLAWNVFASTIGKTSSSMTGNAHLISKVYFPRLVLPLAGILTTLADSAVALVVLTVLLAINGIVPGWGLLMLPIWIGLLIVLSLGLGLLAAAMMVHYRDVAAAVGLVMQLLIYVSPVAYATSAVPERFKTLFLLNPIAPLLDGFRWSVLGRGEIAWGSVGLAAVVAVASFFLGAIAFKRMERKFVDVI